MAIKFIKKLKKFLESIKLVVEIKKNLIPSFNLISSTYMSTYGDPFKQILIIIQKNCISFIVYRDQFLRFLNF